MPPVRPAQLATLVAAQTGTTAPQAPPPTPVEVAYAPPNLDGSRKNCVNCYQWAQADQQCAIHGDMPIEPDLVCVYHVFGQPQMFSTAFIKPPAMDPAVTGLVRAPNGSSCDLCRFFDGTCRAVVDPQTMRIPFRSKPLGCCNRQRPREQL